MGFVKIVALNQTHEMVNTNNRTAFQPLHDVINVSDGLALRPLAADKLATRARLPSKGTEDFFSTKAKRKQTTAARSRTEKHWVKVRAAKREARRAHEAVLVEMECENEDVDAEMKKAVSKKVPNPDAVARRKARHELRFSRQNMKCFSFFDTIESAALDAIDLDTFEATTELKLKQAKRVSFLKAEKVIHAPMGSVPSLEPVEAVDNVPSEHVGEELLDQEGLAGAVESGTALQFCAACVLPTTHHPSRTTRFSLLTAHYSLLTTHYSLFTVHCLLLATHPTTQPTAHCSLLTAHCSLLTAHCSLPTTRYSLLTSHFSPLTAYCLLPTCRL